MSNTTYRPIAGFPGYRVGEDGSVQTCIRFKGSGYARHPTRILSDEWRDLLPSRDQRGRRRFTLRRDGKSHRFRASRLVLEAFIGPCPRGKECCHENGDETDDRLTNLRWDTHSANLLDRRRHGTAVCGEAINHAKLTVTDVIEIRRLRAGGMKLSELSNRFGVTMAEISNIERRKVWQHVE
jgi:hypothetical protein